jgi:hypothetical protein
VSGSAYANYGWVLSRQARADPPGGGSVVVYVDGLAVGSPGGWTAREDLSRLFPGYPGVDRALGVFGLDTVAFGDGLHTIEWSVTDSAGRSSGVGSRFFTIVNHGSLASVPGAMRPHGGDLGGTAHQLPPVSTARAVTAAQGFRLAQPGEPVHAGIDGVRRVWAAERNRLEVRLGERPAAGASYEGYLLVNGRLRELPVGSSFDPARGAFFWQPGLGYLGEFDLLFVRTGANGDREQIPVRVTLQPAPVHMASVSRSPWDQIDFLR